MGRDKPAQLLAFAELALEKGSDHALRQVYRIDGTAERERLWLDEVNATPSDREAIVVEKATGPDPRFSNVRHVKLDTVAPTLNGQNEAMK